MGFSAPTAPLLPPMRTVPATPRLSPSVPFMLRHRARRRGPVPPSICVLPVSLSLPRGPRHRRCPGRRATPAVISRRAGSVITRLISRSTPYLTFLQHQHLLCVFRLAPLRFDHPPPRASRASRLAGLKLVPARLMRPELLSRPAPAKPGGSRPAAAESGPAPPGAVRSRAPASPRTHGTTGTPARRNSFSLRTNRPGHYIK